MKIALGLLGVVLVLAAIVWTILDRPSDSAEVSASPSIPTPALPEHAEIMRMLHDEAQKRQVYWQVWCTAFYEGDEEEYRGIATTGKLFNIYIEEGAPAYWSVPGFESTYKSADEAAYALVLALRKEPNWQPQHKDIRRRSECEILSGEPQ